MNMDSKLTYRELPPSVSYADEVLCSNWNPVVASLVEPLERVGKAVAGAVDPDTFLSRAYLAQRA